MAEIGAYAALFAVAFAAATLLPLSSEVVLTGLLMANYEPVWLIVIASAGTVLGSTVNWVIGRQVEGLRNRPWFPVNEAQLARARRWYRRYGKWSLLLSWVPVVGDPLTIVAGVMREPISNFLVLVTIAKVGRYIAVAVVVLGAP